MICVDCLKGSVYDRSTAPVTTECEVCHDTRPCIRGDAIALFVPFIPLMTMDAFGPESKETRNRCAKCASGSPVLLFCGTCHVSKCFHLMKPASPYCKACVASLS